MPVPLGVIPPPPVRSLKSAPLRRRRPGQLHPQEVLQQLKAHLEKLWAHCEVPYWHQELYAARYCSGGYGPEVLLKEANALASGHAIVQMALEAIAAREAVRERLKIIRFAYSDSELRRPRSSCRKHLSDQLQALRHATVAVVEALSLWRRSVAPLPGSVKRPSTSMEYSREAANAFAWADFAAQDESCIRERGKDTHGTVGGPGSRGVFWPYRDADPDETLEPADVGEDYLLRVAQEDSVVREFSSIMELGRECDPFLLHSSVGGIGPLEPGMLCPPPVGGAGTVDGSRLEAARLTLLEEEMALTSFLASQAAALTTGASRVSPLLAFGNTSPSRLVRELMSPLELPLLKPPKEPKFGRSSRSRRPTKLQVESRLRQKSQSARPVSAMSENDTDTGDEKQLLRARPATTTPRAGRKFSPSSLGPPPPDAAGSRRPKSQAVQSMSEAAGGSRRTQNGSALPELARPSTMPSTLIQKPEGAGSPDSGDPPRERPKSGGDDESSSGDARAPDAAKDPIGRSESATHAPTLRKGPGGIDPARVSSAWNRFESDMMVHHDDMPLALSRCGFVRPNCDWLEDSFVQVTLFNGVNKDEFEAVIENYDQRQRRAFAQEFEDFDSDGSSFIDIHEFTLLLSKLGYEPMSHVLEECIDEVNEDADFDKLDFEKFYTVMKLLAEREGFSKRECANCDEVFSKFDVSGKGEIEVKELYQVLLYLGSPASLAESQEVARTVDLDGSGAIDRQEFVMCMRILRDKEVASLRQQLEQVSESGTGPVSVTLPTLLPLLQASGYHADEDVVIEVLREIGMDDPSSGKLDMSMLWQFLILFRSREGLSRVEAASVREAFGMYSQPRPEVQEGEDEVSTNDLPKILRFIGYCLSFEDQKQLTAQVDIDRSGALSLGELLKLIRFCRAQRSVAIQEAFQEHDPARLGKIAWQAGVEAMKELGCVKDGSHRFPPPMLASELEEGLVSLLAFLRSARRMDELIRQKYRESGGYSPTELQALRQKFNKFDADGSGEVSNKELMSLILQIFPGMATDPRQRPHLMEIIKKADKDGTGSLDFDDFLRLMRAVEDLTHTAQLQKERLVVQETKFSGQEVSEFRDIFQDRSAGKGELNFQDFKEMIARICPMGDRNAAEINIMWKEVISKQSVADFPDFLVLMRKVLETNFGGVIERTTTVAKANTSSSLGG